ncbi:AMP-binding protein [Streptomyces sp. NPDC041068]|uniref:AMP-binding protein n=1 Tax=Streptomyces sp. NPDC041068 TaxID=3155130 RepID=UPI0033FA5FD3
MNIAELGDRYREHTEARLTEIDISGGRRSVTYSRLHELATERAEKLAAAGVEPGHLIGIRAPGSIDWISWDLAALMRGAVLKAFPEDAEVADPAEFVVRHELALLIADGLTTDCPAVIAPGGLPGPDVVPETAGRVDPEKVHSLVYSSGTSGKLKGLNISAKGTEYVINRFIEAFRITASDRHLIFLPLSNYQQRLSLYCCLWLGADLTLAPYQRVFQAVKSERPTFLIGPPVFYDTVLQLHRKSGGSATLGDFLGGAIRFLITGMAPIRRETMDAFWERDVKLLEAYGLTETGMVAWNTEDQYRLGTVGRLLDSDHVRFLDDGEVILHRPAPLSSGYFEVPEEGADDTYRSDGTIATGDFGTLDADGFLTLIGRKKDVIALGNGRKVHPAQIEEAFAGVEGIAEIIVVPTPESGRLGAVITTTDPADEALPAKVRSRIEEVNRRLDIHQRVVSVIFSEQPLRSDARFMTGNLKLSRVGVARHFAETVRGAGAAAEEAGNR